MFRSRRLLLLIFNFYVTCFRGLRCFYSVNYILFLWLLLRSSLWLRLRLWRFLTLGGLFDILSGASLVSLCALPHGLRDFTHCIQAIDWGALSLYLVWLSILSLVLLNLLKSPLQMISLSRSVIQICAWSEQAGFRELHLRGRNVHDWVNVIKSLLLLNVSVPQSLQYLCL